MIRMEKIIQCMVKQHSDETKQKISKSKLGKSLPPLTTTHKSRISNSLKGKQKSVTHRNNLSKAQQNIKPQTCPHCGKSGTHNMTRYHFDNCSVVTGKSHKPSFTKGKIIVIDNQLNETQYDSMAECARTLNVDRDWETTEQLSK